MADSNQRLGIEIYVDKVNFKTDAIKQQIEEGLKNASKDLALNLNVGIDSSLKKLTASIESMGKNIQEALAKGLSGGGGAATKAVKETQDAVERQVNSLSKRMAEALGLPKEAAEQFKKSLKDAFKFEGVEQGANKLAKTKDLMIQVNGEVSKLAQLNDKVKAIFAANPGAEFKIFSKEKLDKQFEEFKAQVKQLNERAVISNVPLGGIQQLMKDNSHRIKTPDDLATLQARFTALNNAVGNDEKLVKLDKVLDGLRQKYLYLGEAAEKILSARALNEAYKSDESGLASAKGVALYGQAVAAARKELESLAFTQKHAGADAQVHAFNKEAARQAAADRIAADKEAADQRIADDKRAWAEYRADINAANAMYKREEEQRKEENKRIADEKKAREKADLEEWKADNRRAWAEHEAMVKHGQAVFAASAEEARKSLEARKQWATDYMNLYTRAGMQPVNRGWLHSSVNTSISPLPTGPNKFSEEFTKLQQEALKINQLLKTNPSYISDVGTAQMAAYREQVDRVISSLHRMSVASGGAGVSLQQTKDALRQAGIGAQQLGEIDIFKRLNRGLSEFRQTVSATTGELMEMKKASNIFTFLGDSLGKVATRLLEFYAVRGAIFAVWREIRQATTVAIEFNQSMHDIIAISGESRDGMQEIGQSIWDIAKASRFTAAEVSGLMQVLAQAGVKAADLPQVSKSVGMFATASATDPKLAGDLFTTAMNVYNIDADHATRITNALTAALNNSKLEASGLATAFNYLAPQAAQLGYSLEQTLGIISTMAQSGVKPSTIGTGVSQMLKEFAAPKQRLLNLLDYYGLTPDQINPLKHSFADIVDALSKARGKAGEVGVAVNHMFAALETRVGRSAVAAINLHGDAFRDMEQSITNTSAALIAYEKSMEGAKARMNVLSQTFHEFISSSLSKMAPLLITVTNSFKGWLDILNTDLGRGAAVVGTFASGIAILTLAIKGLQAAIGVSMAIEGGGGFLARLLGPLAGMASGAPLMAVVGVVAAIAAGVIALGNAFNSSKQLEEEATKKRLEHVEASQKMLDLLVGVKTSMESANEPLKRYTELMALYGGEEAKQTKQGKELAELGNKRVSLTTQQRIALEQLIAKNPEMFAGMQTEIKTYKELIAVIQKYNKEKYVESKNAASEYNKNVADAVKKYAEPLAEVNGQIKRLETQKPKPGGWGSMPPSAGFAEVTPNTWEREHSLLLRRQEKLKSDLKAEINSPENMKLRDKAFESVNTSVVADQKNAGKTKTVVEGMVARPIDLGNGVVISKLVPNTSDDVSLETPGPGPKKEGTKNPNNKTAYDLARRQLEIDKKDLDNILHKAKENHNTTDQIIQYRMDAENLAEKIYSSSLSSAEAANKKEFYDDKGTLKKDYVKAGGTKEKADAMLAKMNEQAKVEADHIRQNMKKTFSDIAIARSNAEGGLAAEAAKIQAKALEDAYKNQSDEFERVLKDESATWDEKLQAHNNDLVVIQKRNNEKLAEKLREIDAKFEDEIRAGKFAPGDEAFQKLIAARNEAVKGATAQSANDTNKESLASLDRLIASPLTDTTKRTERNADRTLQSARQANAIKAQQTWSGDEINLINEDTARAEMANTQEKITAYERLNTLIGERREQQLKALDSDYQNKKLDITKEEYLRRREHIQKILNDLQDENNDKLATARDLINEQVNKLKELSDHSFMGNYLKGVRSVWQQFSNTDATNQQFGSSVSNTFLEGTTNSISNALGTVINPDTDKINDLQLSITKLQQEKAQLQGDIIGMSANTTQTPVEIQSLQDKKMKLEEINNQLERQQTELNKSKDGWTAFAEGMKNTMKTILDEIQKYIAKLLVAWAIEQLVGVAKSFMGGSDSSSASVPDGSMYSSTSIGNFSLGAPGMSGAKFAEGGLVPLNMGQPGIDSVPALLSPSEYVIPASVVKTWGVDHFEKYRSGAFKKFAEGGLVGGGGGSKGANSDNTKGYTLQIVNLVQGDQIPDPGQQAAQIINVINRDISTRGATFRSLRTVMQGS